MRTTPAHSMDSGCVLLDRYRVQRFLALGGTSSLYLADDQRLARTVCVKVLRLGSGEASIVRTTREHFVQEAFALSRLAHPNTLRIYDFGEIDLPVGRAPFQVLEYVADGTLADRVRDAGILRDPTAIAIVSQLAGALGEAHRYGLVHRDVKPNNVLLVGRGDETTAKLADFGIAKAMSSSAGQNWADDTALVAGDEIRLYSVNWSAPEQFRSLEVTPATDVYALALIAIYMFTGRILFETDEPSRALSLREQASELIERAFEERPDSDDLVEVLSAACRLDPNKRLDDPRELAIRLAEAVTPSAPEKPAVAPVSRDTTMIDVQPPIEPDGEPIAIDGRTAPGVIGDRVVEVVTLQGGHADLTFGRGSRVRVGFVGDGDGPGSVHLKGLNCFVARAGGRPTVAIQIDRSCSAELVSPDHRILGQIWLRFGRNAGDVRDFRVANQRFTVRRDQYDRAVALDAGRGGACTFMLERRGGAR